MSKDDMIKNVIKCQVEDFKSLSRKNIETYNDTEDAYFKGKAAAYLLASQAFNKILVDFYGGSYNEA